MGNNNLNQALLSKNDEFYTRIEDIESELSNYTKHFKGKTVYLNCDDARESKFFYYFSNNFKKLGLKKLISSCYGSPDSLSEKAILVEYYGDTFEGRALTASEIGIKELDGDGDFRSKESIELLKEADIVVSNPPFSLFSEYVGQLVDHDKEFLIVGNYNAVSLKRIFPLVRDSKMRVGYSKRGMKFNTSEGIKEVNACWFTSLPVNRPSDSITLNKKYDDGEYLYYDNYDAINVDKVADIPKDYSGTMGVPITFVGRYDSNQFQVLGLSGHREETIGIRTRTGKGEPRPIVNDKIKYTRVFIQNKMLNPEIYPKEETVISSRELVYS